MEWFSHIIGFNWDDGNRHKNKNKHKVELSEAEQVFMNAPLLVVDDKQHSLHEPRLNAFGKTNEGRLLHITFTLRKNRSLIRIISVRPMDRKEREYYEEESR